MIRINLLKTNVQKQSKKQQTVNADEFAFHDDSTANANGTSPVIKMLILIIGPVALFAYEKQHLPTIETQFSEKQKYLTELQTYNSKEDGAVKEIDSFKKNKEKLQTQINSIENLSLNRLLYVKSLETLQVSIPEKAWLTKITDITNFKEDLSQEQKTPLIPIIPKYKLEIEGVAFSEVEISNFIDTLTRNIHFLDVSLVSADEMPEKHTIFGDKGKSQSVSVKRFKIECTLDPKRDNKSVL